MEFLSGDGNAAACPEVKPFAEKIELSPPGLLIARAFLDFLFQRLPHELAERFVLAYRCQFGFGKERTRKG
jgi:hypothetical protein